MEEIDTEKETDEMVKGSTAGQTLTPKEIQHRAKECVDEIQSATGRLKELQDYCKHKEPHIELIQGSLQSICNDCGSVLGYPTKEQLVAGGYPIG